MVRQSTLHERLPLCRYAYPVKYESHDLAEDGSVAEVRVSYDPDFLTKGKPPKGVLNWVAQPAPGKDPATAEARLYSEQVLPAQSVSCRVSGGLHKNCKSAGCCVPTYRSCVLICSTQLIVLPGVHEALLQ